jgi:hypothetical protein
VGRAPGLCRRTAARLALALCLGVPSAALAEAPKPAVGAAFGAEPASAAARRFADWIVTSRDSHGMPFVIVDKVQAKVFVFSPDGRLRGATPALLGLARGDDTVPGIGQRKLASIRPDERTTPAGRFVAARGRDLDQKDVVWIDYEAAVSLHPVVTGKPKERRLQRLATVSAADNRISYGCINVPGAFYDKVVRPAFTGSSGVVYILPEVRSIRSVFATYDAGEPGATASAASR